MMHLFPQPLHYFRHYYSALQVTACSNMFHNTYINPHRMHHSWHLIPRLPAFCTSKIRLSLSCNGEHFKMDRTKSSTHASECGCVIFLLFLLIDCKNTPQNFKRFKHKPESLYDVPHTGRNSSNSVTYTYT